MVSLKSAKQVDLIRQLLCWINISDEILNKYESCGNPREIGKKIYLSELEKQIYSKHEILVENHSGVGKTENNFNVKLKNIPVGSIVKMIPSKIENNFLIS